MIDTVTGWSEITKYNNKYTIIIVKVVETEWLTRYPCPTEITHDQRLVFIGHELRKYLIEKQFGMLAKPSTSRN